MHRGGRGGRGGGSGGKGRHPPAKELKPQVSTTKREEAEVKQLEARIAAEMPAPGGLEVEAKHFADLPLSKYTQTGLQQSKYTAMTQVQRIAVPHALAGYVAQRLPITSASDVPFMHGIGP
jgi:hypothetical protein